MAALEPSDAMATNTAAAGAVHRGVKYLQGEAVLEEDRLNFTVQQVGMRFGMIPNLVMLTLLLVKMAIEIVDHPIKLGGSFHRYVKLPEGRLS